MCGCMFVYLSDLSVCLWVLISIGFYVYFEVYFVYVFRLFVRVMFDGVCVSMF